MDLPLQIVQLLNAANLHVPKLRDYLENHHEVWQRFFEDHYHQTQELRQSDLSAILPLPGYIIEEYEYEEEADEESEDETEEQDEDNLVDAQEEAVHDYMSCADFASCSICANIPEDCDLSIDPNLEVDVESLIHLAECPGVNCWKCIVEYYESGMSEFEA
jgi:hypothetical protein